MEKCLVTVNNCLIEKKTTTEDYTLDIIQSLRPNYFPAIERSSTQIESGTIALNSLSNFVIDCNATAWCPC